MLVERAISGLPGTSIESPTVVAYAFGMVTNTSQLPRVVCAPPSPLTPITHIRGAVVVLSLAALQREGLDALYWQSASPDLAARIRDVVTTDWVPIATVVRHYTLLDAIIPDEAMRMKLGTSAGRGAHRTVLEVLARALRVARQPVAWKVLERLDMIWDRIAQGGGAEVRELGERRARLTFHKLPIAHLAYIRTVFQCHIEVNVRVVEPNARVVVLPHRDDDTIHFNLDW